MMYEMTTLGKKVKPLVLLLRLQLEMMQDLQKKHKPARKINHKMVEGGKNQNIKIICWLFLQTPEGVKNA